MERKEKCQQIFNNVHQYGCVSFVLMLAREVGIVDTLLEADKPLTSQTLAERRCLKERYTREILDCLVTVRLVNASVKEGKTREYYLDVTTKSILGNTTNSAHMLMPHVMMSHYENVKKCVAQNGPYGIPYSDETYRFSDEHDKVDNTGLFLENVPGIKQRLENGIKVLELGSGRGLFTSSLASKYPNSTFTASEWNSDLVKFLNERFGPLPNANATVLDLNNLPNCPNEKFDWIVIKYASHISPDPIESTKGIRRLVAEPNGIFTYLDFLGQDDPLKAMGDMAEARNYTFSIFCCLPLGFLQSADSKAYGCCWNKEKGIQIAKEANFSVKTVDISKGQCLFVAKPI